MTSSTDTLGACYVALRRGFLRSAPQTEVDEKGYVGEATENLIDGVYLSEFEADVRQGDGNELGNKFLAVHSSSALAVNTFAPFKAHPAALGLVADTGFISLHFERKCPHGLREGNPPNLDVFVDGPKALIAVESKCTEHLRSHKAKFRPAYDAEIRDARRKTAWFKEMQRLRENPCAYRWLDAAQLVKHAFGLAYTFPNRPVTLLYLFWEPSNPDKFPIFAEHRAEISQFAESVSGAGPDFVSMSYPELWASWAKHFEPDWLPAHLGRLRTRYGVAA